jgi:rubrerythrin
VLERCRRCGELSLLWRNLPVSGVRVCRACWFADPASTVEGGSGRPGARADPPRPVERATRMGTADPSSLNDLPQPPLGRAACAAIESCSFCGETSGVRRKLPDRDAMVCAVCWFADRLARARPRSRPKPDAAGRLLAETGSHERRDSIPAADESQTDSGDLASRKNRARRPLKSPAVANSGRWYAGTTSTEGHTPDLTKRQLANSRTATDTEREATEPRIIRNGRPQKEATHSDTTRASPATTSWWCRSCKRILATNDPCPHCSIGKPVFPVRWRT